MKPTINPFKMRNSLAQREKVYVPIPSSYDHLFLGCLAQNPRTQRELFERLSPKMLSLCLRYVKETAAAEDVLLVAFRKVFDRISQFGQKGSFEGWIRRIVINECLMHLEKQRTKFIDINLDQISSHLGSTSPDDSLDWEDLKKMLVRLPLGYRTVFELYVLRGLSHEEISKKLQISESTSKSQLSRARVQLQRLLNLN
jgi:RNA polymerase sigma factor (sigma-70 family)